MSDKAKMPRMREQYKDNAIEVSKNSEAKTDVKMQRMQEKEVEIKEFEDSKDSQNECANPHKPV